MSLKSPIKPASPRKAPTKPASIADVKAGSSSMFVLEAKVTSISGVRPFGNGGEDSVFLHMTLLDETGLMR